MALPSPRSCPPRRRLLLAALLLPLCAAACTPYVPPPDRAALQGPGVRFSNDVTVFGAVGGSAR